MNYFSFKEEDKIIKEIIPNAEYFPLINNYGWEWEINGNRYNVRHELNCYGVECDFWEYLDLQKIGTKECYRNFSTFEEMINFLKSVDWNK